MPFGAVYTRERMCREPVFCAEVRASHSYDYFSLGVSFSKIPESFSNLT